MDLNALTDQFFTLAAASDVEGMLAMCTDDGVFKQNIGDEQGLDGLRELVGGLSALGVSVGYSDVRRIVAEQAVTEQHLVTLSRADGVSVAVDICVILRFDDDGKISRLDEYLDSAALAPILA